jgi:hypothetical protein
MKNKKKGYSFASDEWLGTHDDSRSIGEWNYLRTLAQEQPTLNMRETHFLEEVISRINHVGCAEHGEVSMGLMDLDPKYFNNQAAVDEVEAQLIEKNVLRKIVEPFKSEYSLMYNEYFLKHRKAKIPKQKNGIEFLHSMQNIRVVFEMQERLRFLIKEVYPELSKEQMFVVEKIVFAMLDGKCFAIPTDMLITLTFYGNEKTNWDEVKVILKELLEKKIVQAVNVGNEWRGNDNEIIREMPRPHLMLQQEFASNAISLLNFTYTECTALTTPNTRVGQYRVLETYDIDKY